MTWILFDCPSGVSGDMTLGALVDLGVPLDVIERALESLPLKGWSLHAEPVLRSSIAATRVHVELEGYEGSHTHEHTHTHTHTHKQDHAHEPHRSLADVIAILRKGALPPRALAWAEQVFETLARAEAAVHRLPVEKIHFHEVGAVDAIIDIAGACVGLDWLCERHGVQHLRVSQLRVGRGLVRTEHGTMPVPAPAVLELLKGFPVEWSTIEGERVTPTGAAILAALASPLGDAPVRIRATGYGAGAKEFPDTPNVLRIVLAEPSGSLATGGAVDTAARRPVAAGTRQAGTNPTAAPATSNPSPHVRRGHVAVLETTIDDMVPELFGHLMTRLFESGALDVQYVAVQAKKGRPATLVTVVVRPEDAERLAALLLQETTTLGVRVSHQERFELERHLAEVDTPYGRIQVKVAVRPDGTKRAMPEYESVRRVAEAAGVPAGDVYQAALLAARDAT